MSIADRPGRYALFAGAAGGTGGNPPARSDAIGALTTQVGRLSGDLAAERLARRAAESALERARDVLSSLLVTAELVIERHGGEGWDWSDLRSSCRDANALLDAHLKEGGK